MSYPQKVDALTRILEVENFEGMIVFVRTKNETETLAEKLRARGYSAMAINGDVAQVQRERTINQLKAGKLDILVATDVAARGLDVERISHVVNYDIPTDTESYVHRIGRTGRAGRTGDSIAFVTPRERHLLRAIEKATRQPLTQMQLPTVDDVNATRLSRFDEQITQALTQPERIDFFRDVVSHYVSEHDVPEVDVAAALAAVMHGEQPLLLEPEPERSHPQLRRATDPRRQGRPAAGPRSRAAARRWRRTASRSASATRSSRARSSAPWPTRAGSRAGDFGYISIKPDFSLVELPATCPPARSSASPRTRISGKLIELKPDNGPQRGVARRRPPQGRLVSGGGYKGKNPR